MKETSKNRNIWLSAFPKYSGINPSLELHNDIVEFHFPKSPKLYQLIEAFNSNCHVNIQDYISIYKILKNELHNMKQKGAKQ